MNKSYQNFKKRVGKLAVTFALVGTTAAGGMAVAKDSVDAATVKSGYTSTTVTLRKSASTKSAKLTTIKKGAKVTILKTSGKWLKVKYNGKTGYVYKTYVKKTFTTKDYSGKFKLKTDLNVRKGPGTSFVKAGTLKKGTVVTVKGKTSNGWYTITYKGSTRYISASSKYLTKYVAPTPKPEKNNAPTISVNDTYTLVKGENFEFSMLKATASDKEDGDLTSKIDFSGVVDTGKVGDYTVKLTVKDSKGATATKTVKVVVKKAEIKDNQAPVISVKDTYTVGLKSEFKYEDLDAVAYDKEDGDLTIVYGGDTVNTSKVGVYKVTLTATDSLGAKTTKTVEVKVIANVKPVITCPDTYTIEQGKTFDYALLKATAKDFEDGDLTKSIVFSGDKVSTVYSGKTFKITLTVKDSKGAETVKVVNVNVVPDKDPVITASNISVEQGDVLNKDTLVKLSGLKAHDGNGNDITSAVEFIGLDKVNTNVKEG
ncbi:MAG: SH3 domain-containing protein, partial [Clostridium sp.]|nr:SH3 domain-containing protein [Clostridium sp.]